MSFETLFPFRKIERRWQKIWSKSNYKIWHADDVKPKKNYILDMFPYPSGEGLHVGHPVGYIASDILSRQRRMKGGNVLHPMGWDAFGLPAELYAIKTKTPPQKAVKKNIARYRRQLNMFGLSYDWQREINTTDPNYYKLTQWTFIKLFEKGLAYEAEMPVNWCENCRAVLANEEVLDEACERCGSPVVQKNTRQWLLKITAYADKLLEGLPWLDWPENVKEMQKNWIGKSLGAEIDFSMSGSSKKIKVFTTRPDTIFGATFIVVSPSYPQIADLVTADNYLLVQRYLDAFHKKTISEEEKTGVFTGSYAINPMNSEKIPVWISNYVLGDYGTGAVMAVPAHDKRDFDFAKKFRLPIRRVIYPQNTGEITVNAEEDSGLPYEEPGLIQNSAEFSNLDSEDAKAKIIKMLEVNGNGKLQVRYRLRDWIFSRQRYWGEPIPIIKCRKCGNVPVPEKDLPVVLPNIRAYQPNATGEAPLAAIKKWVNIRCPICKGRAKRETNTMPQWAGSCWYYLGYILGSKKIEIKNKKLDNKEFRKLFNKWLPVDVYIGGVEHATLHLLYARFWHKFLYDIKVVKTPEPFKKLVNQGLVLGLDGEKMSKSRGNVITPDTIIKQYGADALRMYEMFMAPIEMVKPWSTQGIVGVWRFLNRVWSLGKKIKKYKAAKKNKKEQNAISEMFLAKHNQTIKKVTEDIENFKYNTAISALMEWEHAASAEPNLSKKELEEFIKLLFPFAPHISQEIYAVHIKNKGLLDYAKWPKWNKKYVITSDFELVIQINGKFRSRVVAPLGINEAEAKRIALADEKTKKFIGGREPKKTVYIQNRLINLIIKF